MISHQRRERYNIAGNVSTKNPATAVHELDRVPIALARDFARIVERYWVTPGSGAVERIWDRWVAVRW